MNDLQLKRLRRGITPKLRKFILDNGALCTYCGFIATEIDHVVPVSRGGGVALANLAPACVECNAEKSDNTVAEWAANRMADGKPWPIPDYTSRLRAVLDSGKLPMPAEFSADITEWFAEIGGYKVLRGLLVDARDSKILAPIRRGGGA